MTTHTPEEAQTLWCPMARVAQAGHTDINVSYNRTITKLLVPVRLQAPQDPDDFDLGQEPSQQMDKTLLETRVGLSNAARCIADKCAAWRWTPETVGNVTTTYAPGQRPGYCGLAVRPEVM